MPKFDEYKAQAKERGALALEVYQCISTPAVAPEEFQKVLPDHWAYMETLEKDGSLMFAGPLSDEEGENIFGEGMLIYRAASLEDAKALADGDPMHAQGARTYTLRKWLINEGSLNIMVGFLHTRVEVS